VIFSALKQNCDFFCFKTESKVSFGFRDFLMFFTIELDFSCSDYSGEALHPHEVHPSEGPERIL
jgi:hypothetical protein